jgi:LDH2 family malate/lactate/ureidoglycolate dehydrogenase
VRCRARKALEGGDLNPTGALMSEPLRVDPVRLVDFAAAVYASAGVPPEHARLVADTLVQADLWGHQSHGVLRLRWYYERLRNGVMQPVTHPELVVDAGAIALIEGNEGIGHVLTVLAAEEAIARAKAHGIGAVGVRNSNHFGTCMYYTLMGARRGCVMLLTSNGGPAMAPWGGMKKIIGTNPWSVATPAGRHPPFVVDMANTGVARGKIYLARQRHEAIPPGWALNARGAPTTDPQEAIDGIILPMAGHKGYAIAMMVDVLSGVLTGSGFLDAVASPYRTAEKSRCGHLMLAIDIERFQPLDEFNARMEDYIAKVKSVPLAQGYDEVFYPGELEAASDERNRREGLSLPEDTLDDLRRIARETGLEALLPFK